MNEYEAITVFREASPADLEALLGLYSLLEFEPTQSLTLEGAEVQLNKYREYPNYLIYVVEVDKLIVGTFALIIVDGIAHLGRPFAIVEDVVVSQVWQRRGIGKLMMKFAMLRCKEFGCYKLTLSSHLNRQKAHSFYELLGFEKHGFSFSIT
jgi:GNAT superfamily N-acetyltransferase